MSKKKRIIVKAPVMTAELENEIRVIVKQQSGVVSPHLLKEMQVLCQDDFNYRIDTSCGKCIYKYSVKLFDKYLK